VYVVIWMNLLYICDEFATYICMIFSVATNEGNKLGNTLG
jgi:hypothetical protein